MPLAYSYVRFSNKRQEHGDSLRRQTDLCDAYLAKHPELTLSNENFQDLGVSAYRGKNAAEGKLRMFLDAVKSGRICRGSYLLIESLDRLSRAQVMDALELFISIINAGITIVTLLDDHVYSRQKVTANWTELILSIALMARATEESETKSDRIRLRWESKRAAAKVEGTIMTSRAPAWLTLSSDRKRWIVDQKKANVVERIYDLALRGHGCPTITRTLNEKGVPNIASGAHWNVNTVLWILRSQAVIGTWTSKTRKAPPIPNYYPAIINADKFAAVQDTLVKRRWIGGRSSAAPTNLFSGLCFCAECNNRMKIISSSHPELSGRHRRAYFRCLSAYEGSGCTQPKFPYEAAERAILSDMATRLSRLAAGMAAEPQMRRDFETERTELKRRLDNLYDLYADQRTDTLRAKLAELEQSLRALDGEESSAAIPADAQGSLAEAVALFAKLKGRNQLDVEERERVRAVLKRIVRAVYFLVEDEHYRVGVTYHATTEPVLYLDVDSFLPKMRRPKVHRTTQ